MLNGGLINSPSDSGQIRLHDSSNLDAMTRTGLATEIVVKPLSLGEVNATRIAQSRLLPLNASNFILLNAVSGDSFGTTTSREKIWRHPAEGYKGAQFKFLLAIKAAIETMPRTDWLWTGDDDAFIITENLRHQIAIVESILAKQGTPQKPVAIAQYTCGHKESLKHGHACGGAGFFLSRSLAENIYAALENCLSSMLHERPGMKGWGMADVTLTFCITGYAGGVIIDSEMLNSQNPAFYSGSNAQAWKLRPEFLRNRGLQDSQPRSARSVTFHYVQHAAALVMHQCLQQWRAMPNKTAPAANVSAAVI
jgi:hypothetical protein